jgi:hypothetical protein
MRGIFLSYRRDDSEGHTGRLYDALVGRFGKAAVFLDVDGIGLGADFLDVIESKVRSCDIVLPIIGKGWLDAKDATGRRRLDEKSDVLRRELECALKHGVTTIPVLVQGAAMPGAASLPASLAPLRALNAFEIRHTRWDSDVALLLDKLTVELGAPVPSTGSAQPAPASSSYLSWAALALTGPTLRAARRRFSMLVALSCVATLFATYLLGAFVFQLHDYVLFSAWALVGGGFGVWHGVKRGAVLVRDIGIALAIALTAAVLMSALGSFIDKQPFWPQNWAEWRYSLMHMAWIALGFFAGSLIGRSSRVREFAR